MTAKKTHWLRTTLIVLVICGIAGLALTSYLFFKDPDPTAAKATLELTFQGAADGVAPNGATYTISDIASEEILTEALEAASLQDKYTVEELQANLVARGVYPADMTNQVMSYESLLNFTANREATVTDYHPTTFDIALYSDFDKDISREQLMALLESILTVYKDNFAKVYANGLQKGNMLFTLQDYDFPQQLEILRNHYTTLAGYAEEMYWRRPSFLLDGAGFNDISVRLNNLIASDITRLSADLTMNALSKDADRLVTQYQFEIHELTTRLENQREQLKKLDALINSYDKNGIIYLGAGNNVTRIDGNSSETYDALVDQRKALADGISEINSQIATYEMKLADLTQTEAADAAESADGETEAASATRDEALTQAQADALQQSITALAEKGDAVIDDFKAMLTAYNEQEINDLTVTVTHTSYFTPKVLSWAFVKLAIKTAGPICALGFMLCMVLIIHSRRREEKQA